MPDRADSLTGSPPALRFIDLGRLPYAPALDAQRQTHAAVVAGEVPPTVLFVEHDPVITISRRKTASQHLIADENTLRQMGIDTQPTDRGGDITYHGPGQLVAYPILRLAPLGLSISRYMRVLEEIIIGTLAAFEVRGVRDACATGVWVEEKSAATFPAATNEPAVNEAKANEATVNDAAAKSSCAASRLPTAKIAALGVRLSRGVTLHGLALNVTTDLRHFQTIVPCGLAGRAVTSIEQMLGMRTPPMGRVKQEMERVMRRHFAMPPQANETEGSRLLS